MIEIQLQDDEFLLITREFNISDKTTWKINDVKVTMRDLQSCIKKYDIQVDNLCQFLPQDRVQDFARMNKRELLRETKRAICRQDLLDKQEDLIGVRKRHKDLVSQREKYEEKLREAKDNIVHLEGKVRSFNKRQEFLTTVKNIDRKITWVKYEKLYEKVDDVKRDRNCAAEVLERQKESIKPVQSAINNLKGLMRECQDDISQKVRNVFKSNYTFTTIEKLNYNLIEFLSLVTYS